MGLDQYAFARKQGEPDRQVAAWRKHANLEGWVHRQWQAAGNTETFNCREFEMTPGLLRKLKSEHHWLREATGFFWGQTRHYQVEATEAFINQALDLSDQGYTIIYTSSW